MIHIAIAIAIPITVLPLIPVAPALGVVYADVGVGTLLAVDTVEVVVAVVAVLELGVDVARCFGFARPS